jgi:hypothetical protein
MKLSKVAQAIYDQAEFLLAQGLSEADALRAAEYTVLEDLYLCRKHKPKSLPSAFVWRSAPEGTAYWARAHGWLE